METKDIVLKVPLHADNFGQELADFLLAVDKAVEDGWQSGTDIPPLIASAIASLVPAMGEFKLAQAELKEDQMGVIKSLVLHIADVVKAFTTKPPVA